MSKDLDTMKIHEIFIKPVDRPIEGVIKADDLATIKNEIEEYVFTNEISHRLGVFFDAYNDYQGANGVWISGFFGSGKSHLLKMLSLLLENQPVDGKPALEYILPKCGDDALLQGAIRHAVATPSKSILFNIDQKADTISKTETDALLSVFVKVLNETCGYYGKQGYVAQFERDLDDRGLLEGFMKAYQDISGMEWKKGREQVILEKENIARAYGHVSSNSRESVRNIIDEYRADYKVSIEDFAKMVHAYIGKQPAGFRLNFFVDEAGQFIADNVRLMTNLQTIAESLATKCRGRSWLVVTAQEDMDKVLGEMGKQRGNDFTKIQDRFKTRLKLTSANVDEVIQKRLLKKNSAGEVYLSGTYQKETNNFGTFFDFGDGSISYRNFRDEKHFISSYPFIPYQFTLFQSAIENLSLHNAFEGKHRSVGERSMLGVFQHVAMGIADKSVGKLATFDLMFEGIRTVLKAQIQRSIITAEYNLTDDFAVQVLKALFLVKYVKEFKATPRNLRVLMHDHFDLDFNALRQKIDAALGLLEQQTYIQRSGEQFEFLTDEEKDVEQEIKNTDVDTGDVASILEDILFTDIIRDRKIRYDITGQDFSYSKKLDDRLSGREVELAIHFISPFHENVENASILQANSLGKAELMIVLPADERLVGDLMMYKKTEKYIRQNQTMAQQETKQKILSDKSFQNGERLKTVRERVRELIGKSRLFASGDEIEVNGEEPRTRITKGFYELVARIYPNLRMIQNTSYNETDIPRYLEITRNTLFGGEATDLSEAEQEMLATIQTNNRTGVRTTMKGLEEKFSRKPYGWYLAAIQCTLAKLCGRGKVEGRAEGNLLESDALARALTNTHGFPNLILDPQIDYTPAQVRRLKDFYNDFFDKPPSANEARALGKETAEGFRSVVQELENLAAQSRRYPFLNTLNEPLMTLQGVLGKPYSYFLTELPQMEETLMDTKEKTLDPIRRFMSGANKDIFDEGKRFVREQEDNFRDLEVNGPARLREILDDPECFKGSAMREAKELVGQLSAKIEGLLTNERQEAIQTIDRLEDRLQQMDEFVQLSPDKQKELAEPFDALRRDVQQFTLAAVIRDALRNFEQNEYGRLLVRMAQWLQAKQQGPTPGIAEPRVEYISKSQLEVQFPRPYLATEAEIDEYLAHLKSAMLLAIQEGKRIRI